MIGVLSLEVAEKKGMFQKDKGYFVNDKDGLVIDS
jgi:hypothetical protein